MEEYYDMIGNLLYIGDEVITTDHKGVVKGTITHYTSGSIMIRVDKPYVGKRQIAKCYSQVQIYKI